MKDAMTLNTLEDVRDDLKALEGAISKVFEEQGYGGVSEVISERIRLIDRSLSHIQDQQRKYTDSINAYNNLLIRSL